MSEERFAWVMSSSFVSGLETLDTDELRRRRAAAEAEEESLSYVRRLLQGRLDILRAELRCRHQAGSDRAGDLLSQLSAVLTDEHPSARDTVGTRATRLRVPDETQPHQQRLEAVVAGSSLDDLEDLPVETLEVYVERLTAHERELSAARRKLFDRIDALRNELAARYKDGRAAISDLLTEPG